MGRGRERKKALAGLSLLTGNELDMWLDKGGKRESYEDFDGRINEWGLEILLNKDKEIFLKSKNTSL